MGPMINEKLLCMHGLMVRPTTTCLHGSFSDFRGRVAAGGKREVGYTRKRERRPGGKIGPNQIKQFFAHVLVYHFP